MCNARTHKAFTLAEILVVVVILGIASAVIIPQIGTRDDLRAAAAARMVMADLIYAQNRAIATQTKHYVIFSTTAPQNYRLGTSLTAAGYIPHPVTKASSYQATFGSGGTAGLDAVSLGAVNIEGMTVLVFDELGTPYSCNPVNGTLTELSVSGGSTIPVTCGTFTITIGVEPFTGEIKAN